MKHPLKDSEPLKKREKKGRKMTDKEKRIAHKFIRSMINVGKKEIRKLEKLK